VIDSVKIQFFAESLHMTKISFITLDLSLCMNLFFRCSRRNCSAARHKGSKMAQAHYMPFVVTRYENSQIEGYLDFPRCIPSCIPQNPPKIAGVLPLAHPRPWVIRVLRSESFFRPS
jgi:hypothetical protein